MDRSSLYAKRIGRAGLALTAGFAYALSFPGTSWWWLAVPAVTLWFTLALTGVDGGWKLESFLAGFAAFGWLLRWFSNPIEHYSSLGPTLAHCAVVLSAALLAGMTILLWGVLRNLARHRGREAALTAAPLIWTGWETAREWLPFPFPWGMLAVAHADQLWAGKIATLIGSTGLSVLLATFSASLAGLFVLRSRLRFPIAVAAALLLIVSSQVGGLLQTQYLPGHRLQVGVIQPAIAHEGAGADKLSAVFELTRAVVDDGAELVIWPESATGYEIDEDRDYRAGVLRLADEIDRPIVLGSLTALPDGRWQNSAVLIAPGRGVVTIAPKRQLVPFGEYLPLRFLFGNLPALATMGDFVAGTEPVMLEWDDLKIAPLVCYEAVFPGIAAEFTRRGATLLVNQTNDSWFGSTSGPAQHLQHAQLRAAETGRPLVRAANTGISTAIDREGRVQRRIELMRRGWFVVEVELGTTEPPGAVLGRVLAGACAMLALVSCVYVLTLSRGVSPRVRSAARAKRSGENRDRA